MPRDETLAEYVRRHLDMPAEAAPPPAPMLTPAPGCRRRRVQAAPPRFEAQERAGATFARHAAGLWDPRLVDIKRLARGNAALLYRGRDGGEAAVVVSARGRVRRSLEAAAFRRLQEVLT